MSDGVIGPSMSSWLSSEDAILAVVESLIPVGCDFDLGISTGADMVAVGGRQLCLI